MTSTAAKPTEAYLIGVTGSIGTGKSLIGKQLQEMGFTVIDTDHLAHELLNNPGPTYDKVLAHFGEDIADGPGKPVNREKLGKIVFADKAEKTALEAIMLPAIRALLLERVADKTGIVFVLVPLLFETNSQSLYNEVWAVTVHPDIQLARLKERDKRSDDELKARIASQFSQEKKAELATLVIDNSGSPEETHASVVKAVAEATTRAQTKSGAPADDKSDTPVPPTADGDNSAMPTASPDDDKGATPPVPPIADGDNSAVPTASPADDKSDTPVPPIANGDNSAMPTASPDGDSKKTGDGALKGTGGEQEAHYRAMLSDMGHIGTQAALDELGQVTTTSGKEASASMSVVVKAKSNSTGDGDKGGNNKGAASTAGSGDANGSQTDSSAVNGSAADNGQERELRVDVRMSVLNRPGTDEPPDGAKPPTPTQPGPANPSTQPEQAPKPESHAPWYHGHGPIYALFGLLGFLAFVLALYMWGSHQTVQAPPTVVVNPTPVAASPAPIIVNPPAVNVTVNPTVVLGSGGCNTNCVPTATPAPCGIDCAARVVPCTSGCTPVIKAPGAVAVETPAVDSKPTGTGSCAPQVSKPDEPPAFARTYLHNQVRWAAAHWTVTTSCERTLVEGFDKEGRVLVRQFYGAYMAFQGQYSFLYLAEGGVQVDKFDNNNIFVQRRIYREAP